jgi:glutaredoxin 3
MPAGKNSQLLNGERTTAVKVTVYSTPTCGYCAAAKRYLKDHKIPFRDIDVSRDPHSAAEMKRKSGQQGVPVIEVNGRIVVGFDKRRLNAALGLKG